MNRIARALLAASLLLAVAAVAPAEAAPVEACVDGTCHEVHAGPEDGASCSVSGDGSGVRAGCHGS
jgi:hypothetical protein